MTIFAYDINFKQKDYAVKNKGNKQRKGGIYYQTCRIGGNNPT